MAIVLIAGAFDLPEVTVTEVGELLDRIHPLVIEMIEVYDSPAVMQAEFLGDSCAAIVIWTR